MAGSEDTWFLTGKHAMARGVSAVSLSGDA